MLASAEFMGNVDEKLHFNKQAAAMVRATLEVRAKGKDQLRCLGPCSPQAWSWRAPSPLLACSKTLTTPSSWLHVVHWLALRASRGVLRAARGPRVFPTPRLLHHHATRSSDPNRASVQVTRFVGVAGTENGVRFNGADATVARRRANSDEGTGSDSGAESSSEGEPYRSNSDDGGGAKKPARRIRTR